MFKLFLKFFKYLAVLTLSFIVVITAAIFWAVKNPQTVWQYAEQHVLPEDMHVSWSDVNLQVKHLDSFNFYFDLEVFDLQVTKILPLMDLPITHIRVQASLFPRSDKQKIRIQQFLVLADKPLRFHPSESAQPNVQKNPIQTIQETVHYIEIFQKYAELKNVDINLKDLRLEESIDIYKSFGLTLLQNEKDEHPNQLNLVFRADFPGADALAIHGDGQVLLPRSEDSNLDLKSHIVIAGLGIEASEDLDLHYSDKQTQIKISGPLSYRKKKIKIKTRIKTDLIMDSAGADINLTADITGIPGSLVKVSSLKLKMHVPFEKNLTLSSGASTFSVLVPIKIFFIDPDMAKPFIESCQCKIPEVIEATLSGKVWIANMTAKSTEIKPVLKAELKLENIDNKLLSLEAAGTIEIDRQNSQYQVHPSINTTAKINSFQGLRRFLDAKGVLIPAPLNVLEGPILFKLQGPVANENNQYIFPALTTIKLNSRRQAVDLEAKARFALNENFKAADAKVEIVVNQLQLELPPLDPIKGKPRITTDQRIVKAKVLKKPSQFKLTVAVEAHTSGAGSIKLLSKYFEPYLPMTLKFNHVEGQKNAGRISLEPFNVNYVRRTVRVEKMQISLPNKNEKFFDVDGRLKIKQSDYTVFIDIQGPSNAPIITLSSEPYLPRSEIISILIYDRTTDALAASDAKTAGNVEAAIVDRAVGLLGIWAFASTPIKGFSYNPVTKVYTATVAVSDDVTASVGTNWEQATQVELRKKVARQWVLTAAWTPAGRDQDETTSLVLQWENRF